MTAMPSFEVFNDSMDRLLNSLKYIKFQKVLLELFLRFLERIWSVFEKLFMGGAVGSGMNQGLRLILGGLILAVIIAIILLLVMWILRRQRRHNVKEILGEAISRETTADSFSERSRHLEQEGHYREALRLRFIGILLFLHQSHILYHDHTMTGSEMTKRLRESRYSGAYVFEDLVEGFNETWYGMRELETSYYEKWCAAEARFWQEVRRK